MPRGQHVNVGNHEYRKEKLRNEKVTIFTSKNFIQSNYKNINLKHFKLAKKLLMVKVSLAHNQCHTATELSKALIFSGPYFWNKLPYDMGTCYEISSFKRQLKHDLLSKASSEN